MEEVYDTFIEVERTRVDEMGSPIAGMTKEEIDLYYEKISKADV